MYAKLLYSNRTKNFVMLSIYFKNHMIYIMFSTISTLTLKFWKNCLDFKRDKKSLANKHLFFILFYFVFQIRQLIQLFCIFLQFFLPSHLLYCHVDRHLRFHSVSISGCTVSLQVFVWSLEPPPTPLQQTWR